MWVNFDVLRILCFPFPELLAAHLQQYVSSFLYTGIYNHCIDWLSLLFVIVIVIIYVIIYSGTVCKYFYATSFKGGGVEVVGFARLRNPKIMKLDF